MYIIINKTRKTSTKYEGGSIPDNVYEDLEKGDKIIVISLYSNTIKIPSYTDQYNVKEWEWENYPFNKEVLTYIT